MISYIGEEFFDIDGDTIVTFGKFDGMHRGHQKLVQEALSLKKESGATTVLFTFARPPANLITGFETKIINTNDEKIRILSKMNLDCLVEYPFTNAVRTMEPEQFISEIVIGMLHAKYVVVGTDFRFGYNRRGDVSILAEFSQKYGYKLIVIDKERESSSGREISSTYIKELLKIGNIKTVNELLGYNFSINGSVLHGNEIGRTIGVPTLNLIPIREKALPLFGVYMSKVIIAGQPYYGITNIGKKPTIEGINQTGVETYIFNFDKEIYGEEIEVELLDFIRPEQKFDSIELLKIQLEKDIQSIHIDTP